MRKNTNIFCAAALMSALCAGFVACNEPKEQETGLGEEIPGMDTYQVTGVVIGYFKDQGYGSWILQVDEEFPIGETIEYIKTPFYFHLPETGIYNNLIQVQHKLPIKTGNRMSFSVREFQKEKDVDLFIIGDGSHTMEHGLPSLPMYVVTK